MIQTIALEKIAMTLSGAVWFTIFDGKPQKEQTDEIYWFLRVIAETTENIAGKLCSIELTLIGRPPVTNKLMRGYITMVTNTMLNDNCMKTYNYDGFMIYGVEDSTMNWPGYTDKEQIVYTKQYNFRFLRTT
jgi:hypothetical protein